MNEKLSVILFSSFYSTGRVFPTKNKKLSLTSTYLNDLIAFGLRKALPLIVTYNRSSNINNKLVFKVNNLKTFIFYRVNALEIKEICVIFSLTDLSSSLISNYIV